MTKRAFGKIVSGLHDAIAIAQGEMKPRRLNIPAELDVKAIRKKTGLTQEAFAYSFGFTIEQIRSWEQGRARPFGGVCAYLMVIDRDHESVARILDTSK